MTYEEAKQTALDVMTDYPQLIEVTTFSEEGKNFVRVRYSKTRTGMTTTDDMTISEDGWILYVPWYEDLKLSAVRGTPDFDLLVHVERGRLYEFLVSQIEMIDSSMRNRSRS